MGSWVKGLGGIGGAVMGDVSSVLNSGRNEQSEGAVVAVDGTDPDVLSSEREPLNMTGELSDMNLRKSVYARGGLMGVLVGSADWGFADSGEWPEMCEGKVAVTGVASCGNLGLVVLVVAMMNTSWSWMPMPGVSCCEAKTGLAWDEVK